MGKLLSFESISETPHSGSKRSKHMLASDFNGTTPDWVVWKTQIKASFRTFNAIQII